MSRASPFPFKPVAWSVPSPRAQLPVSSTREKKNNRSKAKSSPHSRTSSPSRYTSGLYAIRYGIHSSSPPTRCIPPPSSSSSHTLHFQGHCSSRPRKFNTSRADKPRKTSVHARAEPFSGYLFAGPVSVAVIRAGSCPWRCGEQHFIFPTVCRTERRAQPRQPGDVTQRRVWEEIGAARRDHTNPSARATTARDCSIHLIAFTQHNARMAPKSKCL